MINLQYPNLYEIIAWSFGQEDSFISISYPAWAAQAKDDIPVKEGKGWYSLLNPDSTWTKYETDNKPEYIKDNCLCLIEKNSWQSLSSVRLEVSDEAVSGMECADFLFKDPDVYDILARMTQLNKPIARLKDIEYHENDKDVNDYAYEILKQIYILPKYLGAQLPKPVIGRLNGGGFEFDFLDDAHTCIIQSHRNTEDIVIICGIDEKGLEKFRTKDIVWIKNKISDLFS